MTPREDPESLEARLRAAAPVLPPALRSQILSRCRQEQRNVPLLPRYRRWGLTGAFAALVLFCWIASGQLDARNRALLTGDTGYTADTATGRHVDSAQFVLALQWRLRQLALLLHDTHSG